MSPLLLAVPVASLPEAAQVLIATRPVPDGVRFWPCVTEPQALLWTWVGLPAAVFLVLGGVAHLVARVRAGAPAGGVGGFVVLLALAAPLCWFGLEARRADAERAAGASAAGVWLAQDALVVVSPDGQAAWLPRVSVVEATSEERRWDNHGAHVDVRWRRGDDAGVYTLPDEVEATGPELADAITRWAGK